MHLLGKVNTFSTSEASNVNSCISFTATRKFLMFSKYWIADCAAPSVDCTGITGFSTICINYKKKKQVSYFSKKKNIGGQKLRNVNELQQQIPFRTLGIAPGLTLLRTLQRMRPLRSARQNSSSEGSLGRDSEAPWSISRSHSVAWYLLEADLT